VVCPCFSVLVTVRGLLRVSSHCCAARDKSISHGFFMRLFLSNLCLAKRTDRLSWYQPWGPPPFDIQWLVTNMGRCGENERREIYGGEETGETFLGLMGILFIFVAWPLVAACCASTANIVAFLLPQTPHFLPFISYPCDPKKNV
jgi:hypothetical protein